MLSEKYAVKERYVIIVLNDSASPEMVIKLYFNIFNFFIGFRAVWMTSKRPMYDC